MHGRFAWCGTMALRFERTRGLRNCNFEESNKKLRELGELGLTTTFKRPLDPGYVTHLASASFHVQAELACG